MSRPPHDQEPAQRGFGRRQSCSSTIRARGASISRCAGSDSGAPRRAYWCVPT